jgi:hypothetical protein
MCFFYARVGVSEAVSCVSSTRGSGFSEAVSCVSSTRGPRFSEAVSCVSSTREWEFLRWKRIINILKIMVRDSIAEFTFTTQYY